jgi:hypothetical protein
MAQGILTPLQITAAAALLNNQGIKPLPAALTTALNTINATTLFSNFLIAVNTYLLQDFADVETLEQLLTIGNTNCPALGNSIPVAYANLDYPISPVDGSSLSPFGFTGLIEQTGNEYLGDGNTGQFCQGFMAVQGYLGTVNQFINSAVNAQTYLGPTFTNMDALVTNNISELNPEFDKFATDLYQQGQLWNPANMEYYGTPAGLLQQISVVGKFAGAFFGGLQSALLAQGLTSRNIQQLLQGQNQLTTTEFNTLQQLAYVAMTEVTGDSLNQVLQILDCTLPNINNMADLLNPVKTFPQSYNTLNVPLGAAGWQPIYNPGNSVNLAVIPAVNAVLPTASGCDELAKVIPPDQAVANKALQVSMSQLTGLPLTTFPELAQVIRGLSNRIWNPNITYQANAVVSWGSGVPTNYQAQQDVPQGIDITNPSYWLPTDLGGLNTMAGLPLIQAQTTPIATSVSSYFSTSQATGSGTNGTITTYDVIGLAVDSDNFAGQLATATTNIDTLQTAGALATLNTALTDIASAATNPQVITYIDNANAAIASIVANPTYATEVAALNTVWDYMASILSQELTYQTNGGIDYFSLQANEQTSIMAFVQQLPQYGLDRIAGGACEFLEQVADTSILGGQAIVGSMREGQNNQRLVGAQLSQDTQPSTQPAITPIPVITPVY